MALVALTALPAAPADAAALPKPRLQEWWFSAWDIPNKVWPLTQGQGITVAVVDTGVNANLPGLRGVVLPGLNARQNGTGDGRTDTDKYGHGTGMAELIAGQGKDDGMVGVAPAAKILPITADDAPATQATAIRYAVDHGAQVINISLGSADDPGPTCISYYSALQEAVAYAAEKNVVVVAAAGNEGHTTNQPDAPANCAGVLAVGAIDGKKVAWSHSEHQPYVAVAAPGVATGSVGKNGKWLLTNGTSNAAALTSGAVALLRAKYPSMPAREVVQKIINTTAEAGPPGHDEYTGSGVVVPIWALTKDVDKAAPNPPYERLDQWLATRAKKSGATPSRSAAQAAKKSGSSSGIVAAIVVVAILVVVVGVIVLLLALRRRRGAAGVPQRDQFSAPGGYPPLPGPGFPGNGPGIGRREGPPPSFRPPEGR